MDAGDPIIHCDMEPLMDTSSSLRSVSVSFTERDRWDSFLRLVRDVKTGLGMLWLFSSMKGGEKVCERFPIGTKPGEKEASDLLLIVCSGLLPGL